MQTTTNQWTMVAKPSRGGQRFFRNAGGTLFVADESGHNPDWTADGPLAVLPGRIILSIVDRKLYAVVFVLCQRDHKVRQVFLSLHEATWLKRSSGMEFTVELPAGLKELLE